VNLSGHDLHPAFVFSDTAWEVKKLRSQEARKLEKRDLTPFRVPIFIASDLPNFRLSRREPASFSLTKRRGNDLVYFAYNIQSLNP
jgi:hypothetical protein